MTHSVRLVSITPNAEELIAYCARVSNPTNQHNKETAPRLLKYLIKHQHWSPFEMANMVVEIKTNRAIAAQILRHRSFSFQEFSQRYAEVESFPSPPYLRRQDVKNRQNSIDDLDIHLMQKGAQLFEGQHNFRSFCTKPSEHTKVIRTVDYCRISPNTEFTASFFPTESYVLEVRGAGFLRYQIRLMMATLIEL